WTSWFLSSKCNKSFCGVEEDYILDRSNLTSLKDEPSDNAQTLDPVAGVIGSSRHFLQTTCYSYHLLGDDIQNELTGALDGMPVVHSHLFKVDRHGTRVC
ncbi:hypothetical protein PAXINDRAFT_89125, partial [Paxillus involutus ATCC 200175]